MSSLLGRLIRLLALIYHADRWLKMLNVATWFRQEPQLRDAPSLTLLNPITAGVYELEQQLRSRLEQEYPGPVQHLWILDQDDQENQAICARIAAAYPDLTIQLLTVPPNRGPIASKIAKLNAAVPQATGAVLVFIDDDVRLRPGHLRRSVAHLEQPGVGAVFGLACYVNWNTVGSSLMSGFVNANALPSYLLQDRLSEPYTITGHVFCLRREVYERYGGLAGREHYSGDDHELARQVRRQGLRCVQTPVIYDVTNQLETVGDYVGQMRRWFVFPRQTMLPYLPRSEQVLTMAGSAANGLPPLVAAGALVTRKTGAWGWAMSMLLSYGFSTWLLERLWLGRRTPAGRWPLVVAGAIIDPLMILAALGGEPRVRWRGQELWVHVDEPVEAL